MDTQYDIEDLKSFLIPHLEEQGFQIQEDKILHSDLPWRPPLWAKKDEREIVLDIRINNSITNFWLKIYRKTYDKCPNIKIFVAIPKDIIIPYPLGKSLEENNIGLILVADEEITYLLEPRSIAERETTKAIRKILDAGIDKMDFEDMEPYTKEITDAVNIFEIGCPREAIGAIGRVLETAIDDFLIEANRQHKIPLAEDRRRSMTFHNKIEFLASIRNKRKRKPIVIDETEKSKMLSVKWDRNIGNHPAGEEEVKRMIEDSRAILELGINKIRLMKRKREEL